MVKTTLKRGDTWRLVFTYTDALGAPVDLSGASALPLIPFTPGRDSLTLKLNPHPSSSSGL